MLKPAPALVEGPICNSSQPAPRCPGRCGRHAEHRDTNSTRCFGPERVASPELAPILMAPPLIVEPEHFDEAVGKLDRVPSWVEGVVPPPARQVPLQGALLRLPANESERCRWPRPRAYRPQSAGGEARSRDLDYRPPLL